MKCFFPSICFEPKHFIWHIVWSNDNFKPEFWTLLLSLDSNFFLRPNFTGPNIFVEPKIKVGYKFFFTQKKKLELDSMCGTPDSKIVHLTGYPAKHVQLLLSKPPLNHNSTKVGFDMKMKFVYFILTKNVSSSWSKLFGLKKLM